jgi:hypothetical protein
MNAPVQSRIDVKEAVRAGKAFVADILAAEKVSNIGLEEVRLDEDQWLVTVGFSHPWDYPNQKDPAFEALLLLPRAEGTPDREYKVVKVDAATGEIRGMELREENA